MSQEPLDAREVTFGDVTFQIGKMFPMEAKQVFMNHVRPLLRGALSAETKGGDQWQLLLAAFTDAPQKHYDAIIHSLYSHIQYKNSEATALAATSRGRRERIQGLGHGSFSDAGREGLLCKFSRVLGRRDIGVTLPKPGFQVVRTLNIDPFSQIQSQRSIVAWLTLSLLGRIEIRFMILRTCAISMR